MKAWISLQVVFYLIGIVVMLIAFMSWRDASNPRRWSSGLFWFLFGSVFIAGDAMQASLGKPLTYRIVGGIVLILALIAGCKGLGTGQHTQNMTARLRSRIEAIGKKIFLPALAIPFITVILTLAGKHWQLAGWPLLDQSNLTLASLVLASLCALAAACWLSRDTPLQAVREAHRLVDAMGWALILPQLLAMLGGVFVAAHTGQAIQQVVSLLIQPDSRLGLVLMYCGGMALFTMIMGNAFAAFPVMTAGIALPFLIQGQHAHPAAVVAIGMFSGYCGTLMTPMAANFNIVPAALLELRDQYQVIKIQIPTAMAVLVCNVMLMYFLAF